MKASIVLLLLAATPAFADNRPEGCYRLGILIPKAVDAGFTSADISANQVVPTEGDICVIAKKASAVKDSIQTGEFVITIGKGNAAVATYKLAVLGIDGSGSHDDFVYAPSAAVLRAVTNVDAYARGNSGPIENTVFYILTNDSKNPKAPAKKPGDHAGTVTLGDLKYALLVK